MPISPTSFDYDFGTSNSGPYNDTPGAAVTYPDPWPVDLDPAQRYCHGRWYVPTKVEFEELFNNCDFVDADGSIIPDTEPVKRITINGVRCIRLRSRINGKEILLTAAGNSNGTRLLNVNENGYAWYADLATAANGYAISFSPTNVQISRAVTRFYGYPIRPVWRPTDD